MAASEYRDAICGEKNRNHDMGKPSGGFPMHFGRTASAERRNRGSRLAPDFRQDRASFTGKGSGGVSQRSYMAKGKVMEKNEISRATLGRLPMYIKYLKSLPEGTQTVSATSVAKDLNLGEVQVRKDLGALSRTGRPRIGYLIGELLACMEKILSAENGNTVIVGAGKLGKALLDYGGFAEYGISILAAFDKKITKKEYTGEGKLLLPVEELSGFCLKNNVKIGVIAVPAEAAQEICNLFYENGIKVMWCFSPCQLHVPSDAVIQYENMALSLAHLKTQRKT